jgi:hypothetical protein
MTEQLQNVLCDTFLEKSQEESIDIAGEIVCDDTKTYSLLLAVKRSGTGRIPEIYGLMENKNSGLSIYPMGH